MSAPVGRLDTHGSERLPQGWAPAQLGELASLVRGISFPSHAHTSQQLDGRIACLRTANVQRQVEWDDLWFVPRDYVRRDDQIVQDLDILISTANSRELVGKVAQVRSAPTEATIGAFIAVIRPLQPLDAAFVYYQLASSSIQAAIRETASTTTNISNVSTAKLVLLPLVVAPRAEQGRIVAEIERQFTHLDAATASLQAVRMKLKRYRAAVLQAACEGRLVPTEAELAQGEGREYEPAERLLALDRQRGPERGKRRAGRLWGAGVVPSLTEEEAARLPEGWVWAKVRDLGSDPDEAVQVGPMSMQSKEFKDAGVPVLNVGCVQWGAFNEEKLNFLPPKQAAAFDRYRIQPGDVLFTRSGTVGRCAVARPHQADWLMTFTFSA